MGNSLINETELPGRIVTLDTLQIIAHRYFWAKQNISGQLVLEVGCGPGFALGYLAGEAKTIIGGDITLDSLRYAKNHYCSNANLIQMDASNLPFKDGSLDTIICLAAVIYLDMPSFLKECRRVLKKGGSLLINTPNKDVPGFKPSFLSHEYFSIPELNSMLKNNNFDATFFGAFAALKGWKRIKSRIASKSTASINKSLNYFNRLNIRKFLGINSFCHTLRPQLTIQEINLAKNICTNSLPSSIINNFYRIIYILGKAQ